MATPTQENGYRLTASSRAMWKERKVPVMFGGLIYCHIQELITARGPENEGGKKKDEQYGKRGNSVCLGELAWLSELKPQSSIAGVSWGRAANPPGPPLTTYFLLGGGKSLSEELAVVRALISGPRPRPRGLIT